MLLRVAVVVEDVSRAVTDIHKCVMSRDFSQQTSRVFQVSIQTFLAFFVLLLLSPGLSRWGYFVYGLFLFWFTYHRSSIGSSLM